MNQIFEGPSRAGDGGASHWRWVTIRSRRSRSRMRLPGLAPAGGVTAYFHLPRGALRVGDHVRISLEKIEKEGS